MRAGGFIQEGQKTAQDRPGHGQDRPIEGKAQAIRERFSQARDRLTFWQNEYEKGRNVEDLIAAAQAWGVMAGLAAAAQEIGSEELAAELERIEPKLYPRDYKPSE